MQEMYQRVDTLFIPVTDVPQSIRWYQEVLGCQLVWNENDDYAAMNIGPSLPDGKSANIEFGRCMITLVKADSFSPLLFHKEGKEHAYFNFYCKNMVEAYAHLKKQGVEVTDLIDEGNLKYFNFYEINGHFIGVCSF